jgi:hypothetical protein
MQPRPAFQNALALHDTKPPAALPVASRHAETRPVHVSGFERTSRDFYATPSWVTEALLRHVTLRGPVWEPCCGDGAMSGVLAAHGHDVVSTDIADRGFGTPGVDFLACRAMPPGCRSIVTNPPYGETGTATGQQRSAVAMLKFVRHAMQLASAVEGQVALLVRLQWIAGQRAADVLSSGPFHATIVLNRRIQWFDMGAQTKNAQHHHAWVVLDWERRGGQAPALLFG